MVQSLQALEPRLGADQKQTFRPSLFQVSATFRPSPDFLFAQAHPLGLQLSSVGELSPQPTRLYRVVAMDRKYPHNRPGIMNLPVNNRVARDNIIVAENAAPG